MCTGKRQTHIRSAPSSRTAVTGINPYNGFKNSVGSIELLQISRERSKKTEAVFLVASRRSGGKSKSLRARFLFATFSFGEAKEKVEPQPLICRSLSAFLQFHSLRHRPKIYSRPGVLGREHTCFVVPPKFGSGWTLPSCARDAGCAGPAISARCALYACSADVLPGAAARAFQRHGPLSGQAESRYCFRVVAKIRIIGSFSCSSSSCANPDRRAAIRGSAFLPRPDLSRTGRWTNRTGGACA